MSFARASDNHSHVPCHMVRPAGSIHWCSWSSLWFHPPTHTHVSSQLSNFFFFLPCTQEVWSSSRGELFSRASTPATWPLAGAPT
jgi:hypothetical protein